MIMTETMTSRAHGAWAPVTRHAAASPFSSGMRRGPVTLPRTKAQVRPQLGVTRPAAVDLVDSFERVDLVIGRADALVVAGNGTTPQYGKAPHDTGTRACRQPV